MQWFLTKVQLVSKVVKCIAMCSTTGFILVRISKVSTFIVLRRLDKYQRLNPVRKDRKLKFVTMAEKVFQYFFNEK